MLHYNPQFLIYDFKIIFYNHHALSKPYCGRPHYGFNLYIQYLTFSILILSSNISKFFSSSILITFPRPFCRRWQNGSALEIQHVIIPICHLRHKYYTFHIFSLLQIISLTSARWHPPCNDNIPPAAADMPPWRRNPRIVRFSPYNKFFSVS